MGDNWKSLSSYQKGTSHVSEGSDCQDFVKVLEDDKCIVAALADGLGSLKNSAFAAHSVVDTICSFFSKNAELIDRRNVFQKQAITNKLIDLIIADYKVVADDNNFDTSTADCTLCFLFISKTHKFALIGIVGDSAVCVINSNGSFCLNDAGKYANSTNTVLNNDAKSKLILKVLDLSAGDILGFILTSDGLENEVYRKGSNRVKKNAELYFNSLLNDNSEQMIKERLTYLSTMPDSVFTDDLSIAVISRATDDINLKEDPTWLCVCGQRNKLENTFCSNCSSDFIKVYSSINFSKIDKDLFFEELNSNPDKEKEVLKQSPSPLMPVRKNKKNKKLYILIICIAIIALICSMAFILKKVLSGKKKGDKQTTLFISDISENEQEAEFNEDSGEDKSSANIKQTDNETSLESTSTNIYVPDIHKITEGGATRVMTSSLENKNQTTNKEQKGIIITGDSSSPSSDGEKLEMINNLSQLEENNDISQEVISSEQ